MIKIPCPWCGPRAHTEFTYGGDAINQRPKDSPDTQQDTWYDYVFGRDNPKGDHLEYWHHVNGCRQWLKVKRSTITHEIIAVGKPTDKLGGERS